MNDIEQTGDVRREASRALEEALYEIKRVIVGQDAMLERLLVSLLAGGHVLLEGVPGLAKTLTVKTLAAVLGGSYNRIQFTPDLVPADLVGTLHARGLVDAFDIPDAPLPQMAVVRGDKVCASIMAASIVAKVARDRTMVEYDRIYPGWGFADHKGYATPSHRAAIRRLGPSPIHRTSWAPFRVSELLEA